MLIAFHKPYGVVSQFTPDGSKNETLAAFGLPKDVYPLGRLDADSEGLLLLSDEGELNAQLLRPEYQHGRVYWSQVELVPTAEALTALERGDRDRWPKNLALQSTTAMTRNPCSRGTHPPYPFPENRSHLLDRAGTH